MLNMIVKTQVLMQDRTVEHTKSYCNYPSSNVRLDHFLMHEIRLIRRAHCMLLLSLESFRI